MHLHKCQKYSILWPSLNTPEMSTGGSKPTHISQLQNPFVYSYKDLLVHDKLTKNILEKRNQKDDIDFYLSNISHITPAVAMAP